MVDKVRFKQKGKALRKNRDFKKKLCDNTLKVAIRITGTTSHEIHIYYLHSSALRRGKCLKKTDLKISFDIFSSDLDYFPSNFAIYALEGRK